jgi:hypothetical protein
MKKKKATAVTGNRTYFRLDGVGAGDEELRRKSGLRESCARKEAKTREGSRTA